MDNERNIQSPKQRSSLLKYPARNEIIQRKTDGIYTNGVDNLYPQRIERVRDASVTAKTATAMLSRFIIGNGFEDDRLNSLVVNSDLFGETTLLRLATQLAQTLATHSACSLQIQYDGLLKISGVKQIPYRDIRFGRSDSKGYTGKIHTSTKWDKITNAKDAICVDIFNPIQSVLVEQSNTKKWRGQIAVLKYDSDFIYPLATFDAAFEDADTENQIALFKNKELRGGFFAKYIIHHSQFNTEEDAAEFKGHVNGFMGGGHEKSTLLLEGSFDADGKFIRSDSIAIEKIEQNINDKIFEGYEKTISNNIRKICCAIPKILIDSEDSSIFGQSGEAIIQSVNFYNMQTSGYRTALSEFLRMILKHHTDANISSITNFNIKTLSYGIVDISGSAGN
jgi:hypothetical protein